MTTKVIFGLPCAVNQSYVISYPANQITADLSEEQLTECINVLKMVNVHLTDLKD